MVYIIEFSAPLGSDKHSARYYIGSCRDDLLDERLAAHRSGRGAAITRAAAERGIDMQIIITFPGGRDEERKIKRQKNTPRLVGKLKGELCTPVS